MNMAKGMPYKLLHKLCVGAEFADGRTFTPSCSCGWRGEPEESERTAWDTAVMHASGAKVVPEPGYLACGNCGAPIDISRDWDAEEAPESGNREAREPSGTLSTGAKAEQIISAPEVGAPTGAVHARLLRDVDALRQTVALIGAYHAAAEFHNLTDPSSENER